MKSLHLWPQETKEDDEMVTAGFVLEGLNNRQVEIWYRFPSSYKHALTESCEPYVTSALFAAMRARMNLRVHGRVSPTLLANFEELQEIWVSWKPEKYRPVDIQADEEAEPTVSMEKGYLTSFSGGVDSSFTVWRHHHKKAGRGNRMLTAGILIQGFEIPLRQERAFHLVVQKARRQLESLGMSLIPMVTNYRHLMRDFFDSHTPAIAACMMLLQRGFSGGLIPSTYPYAHLTLPWSSSPLTDCLLSSGTFPIHHDGAGYTRLEKIRALAEWPEALKNLRVCNQALSRDRNCCRCEKCMNTILAFRLLNIKLPPCFEKDLSTAQIAAIRFPSPAELTDAQIVLQEARRLGVKAPWVQALGFTLLWNRLRLRVKRLLFKG